ncbi:eukaryotic translation initiation factor 4B2-like protein [Tanacetum coccineum]
MLRLMNNVLSSPFSLLPMLFLLCPRHLTEIWVGKESVNEIMIMRENMGMKGTLRMNGVGEDEDGFSARVGAAEKQIPYWTHAEWKRTRFFVVAGPNVIESEEHIMYMARQIKAITTKAWISLRLEDCASGINTGGGGFSRADEIDNWAMNKEPIAPPPPARSSTFGAVFRDSNPHKGGSASTETVVKTNKPSPFGNATPREEILAEKGLDWKKTDLQLEANKINSRPTSSHSNSMPGSAQSGQSGDGLEKPTPKVNPFGDAKPGEVLLQEKGIDYRKIDLELERRRFVSFEGRVVDSLDTEKNGAFFDTMLSYSIGKTEGGVEKKLRETVLLLRVAAHRTPTGNPSALEWLQLFMIVASVAAAVYDRGFNLQNIWLWLLLFMIVASVAAAVYDRGFRIITKLLDPIVMLNVLEKQVLSVTMIFELCEKVEKHLEINQ